MEETGDVSVTKQGEGSGLNQSEIQGDLPTGGVSAQDEHAPVDSNVEINTFKPSFLIIEGKVESNDQKKKNRHSKVLPPNIFEGKLLSLDKPAVEVKVNETTTKEGPDDWIIMERSPSSDNIAKAAKKKSTQKLEPLSARATKNKRTPSDKEDKKKKPPGLANDLLLLSTLSLGCPDWEDWKNCSPTQMWHYIPLFFRIFSGRAIPAEFYAGIKPLFDHPKDQSIRQLTYWLGRCEMVPPEAVSQFGEPHPELVETGKFFNEWDSKTSKVGEEKIFQSPARDPLFGIPLPLASLKVLKIFHAQSRPVLCEIHFSDPGVDSKHFIYKEGDDLSDDMFAQIMFFVFNKIWQNSGMARKPFIHLYRVLPISAKKGFVEFVKSCPIQSYQWVELLKFDEKKKEEFILSAAGAFAGAFILGIRDRHRDNMMISDIGHFFHIDFGYMFNNRTWFDANRFAIPSEIRTLLPHQWEGFLELIGDAYKMLRRNRGLITFLVSKLFSGNKYKEPQIIKCLSGAFYEQMTEKEAVEHIRDLASKGEASPKKAIKDLVHKIESKKKNI